MNPGIFKLLECGVCLDFFKKPICLECGHVFCLECVLDLQRHSKESTRKHPQCPCCKKAFKPKTRIFWKPCYPMVQILELFTESTESPLDLKFDVDLESLSPTLLNSLP